MSNGIGVAALQSAMDFLLGNGTPTNVRLRLYTANPNFFTGVGGTELSGSGYSTGGVLITNNSTNWPAATNPSTGVVRKANGAVITVFTSNASINGITGAALFRGDNNAFIFGRAFANPININANTIFQIPEGVLYMEIEPKALS